MWSPIGQPSGTVVVPLGTLTGTILDVPDDNTEWDKFTALTKRLLKRPDQSTESTSTDDQSPDQEPPDNAQGPSDREG